MEAGKNLFCSSPPFPTRIQHRTCLSSFFSSSTSVLMLYEQAAPAVTSKPTTSVSRHFPTSVVLQEQRDECRPMHMYKEERESEETLDRRLIDIGVSVHEENNPGYADQLVQDFWRQLHRWPSLWHLMTSIPTGVTATSSSLRHVTDKEKLVDAELSNAVFLAEKALSASKQAASIAEDSKSIRADLDGSRPLGLPSTSLANSSYVENITVKSTRLLERRSKRRKVPKSNVELEESYYTRNADVQRNLHVERKISDGFDQSDPLRLFLWGPETRQLLTLEEESQLIVKLQDLLRLEKVKSKLQSQFGREPTLVEWAEGVGLSCRVLQSELHAGNYSREKLVKANLRLVVHIAKHYQGRGLSLQDLLQEGSMGLMKSVEKFKPQAGCRFATYAYWWIRQTIRKAIFQHSRTIRLPENVYTLLGKVMEAKKLSIQEGNLRPTKEELARRVGITVDKLEKLFFTARIPLSMQQTVWSDQDITFQEVTADSAIEIPDVSVAKQLMRQHTRNLLSILSPKERRIIRLRFGIEDGEQKSLSEIGSVFGLSKERVRQLEYRALYKLKQCLGSQGLDAYTDLLV
ncbi:RNA polymerase sigma factor [Quillaja saponaria]|uniref:RNA polymerase sigma factor n=1 Tax=Quillaja saponaria TaxID=32244 RepID=A0AAD7VEA0_QUISA|nr:RNA polymerase sigma factor [Quillaja saponaria]KAJ7972371.1 RNA polymerase sigma factor [Quillaja saponaria]